MIFCVARSGKPLSPELQHALFETGQEMYREQRKSANIRTDDGEGQITSDFEYRSFVHIFGIFFVADIETESGKTHVEFVIHDCDLIRKHLQETRPGALNAQWN